MHTEKQFQQKIIQLTEVWLLVSCLLLSIPAGFAFQAQRRLADSFHWVAHTIEVRDHLQQIHSLIVDAESSERGYLLTSREKYLRPCQSSLLKLPQELKTVRALIADNPVQQEHLRMVESLLADKLDFLTHCIALQRAGKPEESLALTKTDHGNETMEAIRVQLERMTQEEDRLLVGRQQNLSVHSRTSMGLLSALVVLNLLFAATMLFVLHQVSKVKSLITMCAWSRTVEFEGKWISFEEYMLRRFNINTSHSISPAEQEKVFANFQEN